jgi:hypothetical protein
MEGGQFRVGRLVSDDAEGAELSTQDAERLNERYAQGDQYFNEKEESQGTGVERFGGSWSKHDMLGFQIRCLRSQHHLSTS